MGSIGYRWPHLLSMCCRVAESRGLDVWSVPANFWPKDQFNRGSLIRALTFWFGKNPRCSSRKESWLDMSSASQLSVSGTQKRAASFSDASHLYSTIYTTYKQHNTINYILNQSINQPSNQSIIQSINTINQSNKQNLYYRLYRHYCQKAWIEQV